MGVKSFKKCDDCPCLNTDIEYGSSCNLGNEVTFTWFAGDLMTLSEDCNLSLIEYGTTKFTPTEINIDFKTDGTDNK